MSKSDPLCVVLLALSSAASAYAAPVAGYTETVLQTSATDPDLVNPWGISASPNGPFWVSDNATGKTTLYNTAGVKQGLVVSMPNGSQNITGQVFNNTASFHADNFIFASENGTIAGWRGSLGTTAETLFGVANASYKGLAISSDKTSLYAANFASGHVDVFNSAGLTASITDPSMPAGYAPFNVQSLGGTIYVTFALRGTGGEEVAGAGNGYVSIFDPLTSTFTRLASRGVLDAPWGLALAPTGFGALGGDLLVGNFGDGTINAFDPTTGAYVGTLADLAARTIVNDGLWGLQFGNGGDGGLAAALYVTAGPNNETGGVFAQITAVPEPSSAWLIPGGLVLLVAMRRRDVSRRSKDARSPDQPNNALKVAPAFSAGVT